MTNAPERPPQVPRAWRPRFGLGTLLLAMLVVSVVAAAGSYMVRAFATGTGRSAQLTFMLFTLAAPMLLMVVVSVAYQVFLWMERTKKR